MLYLNNKDSMPRTAILIKFTIRTRNFGSNSERNKFFRELYGWKQIVTTEDKRYEYRREGLLDEMPHLRVDKSMFIIMRKNLDRMRQFFEEWDDKINWNEFDVILRKEQQRLLREWLDE